MSSQFQVFNGLHFAFLVKTKGLSQSKNEHKQLFWNLLMTSAYGRRAGLAKSLQIGIRGLSAVNFICSSYTWVEMDSTQLPSDFESCGDVNIWCRGGGGSAVLQYEGEKKFWCWCHETISLCSQTVYQHLEHYNCISHFIYMYIHCEYRNIELHLATNHDSVWINIYLMLSGVSQLYQTLSQPFSAFSMDKYLYGATWCATVLPTIVPAIQYG